MEEAYRFDYQAQSTNDKNINFFYNPQGIFQHQNQPHETPSALPQITDDTPVDEEPLYVNAKQYFRILKRRLARARLEELHRLSKQRKPYLHESRHRHAMRRPRGPGGRFLTAEEIAAQKASGEGESSAPAMNGNGNNNNNDEDDDDVGEHMPTDTEPVASTSTASPASVQPTMSQQPAESYMEPMNIMDIAAFHHHPPPPTHMPPHFAPDHSNVPRPDLHAIQAPPQQIQQAQTQQPQGAPNLQPQHSHHGPSTATSGLHHPHTNSDGGIKSQATTAVNPSARNLFIQPPQAPQPQTLSAQSPGLASPTTEREPFTPMHHVPHPHAHARHHHARHRMHFNHRHSNPYGAAGMEYPVELQRRTEEMIGFGSQQGSNPGAPV